MCKYVCVLLACAFCTMVYKIVGVMCSAASRKLCHFNRSYTIFVPFMWKYSHTEMGHTPKTYIQYNKDSLLFILFRYFFSIFFLFHFTIFTLCMCVVLSLCRLKKLSFHSVHHYPQLVFKAGAAIAINDQIVQIRFVKLPFNLKHKRQRNR